MNEYVASVILGAVEGLTEFIPVSSTGHLILAGELLGFTGERAKSFEIFIQLGAILAIVWLYWHRFAALVPSRAVPGGLSGLRGAAKLLVACVPAGLLGFAVHGYIKEYLFNPATVGVALLAGGVVMLLVERFRREPHTTNLDSVTFKQAFAVGCFQCFSLWPGVSRSASTIIGGMLAGMERRAAAEFSFLVAVPIMFAATGFELFSSASVLGPEDLGVFVLGFLVSFISAIAAVRFFIRLLGRWTLAPFAWYRIAVGVALLIVLSR